MQKIEKIEKYQRTSKSTLNKNRRKGRMESMLKNKAEQGITLVALVITIIIIIILATVTINMAFGDNGLITQAQLAKDMTLNSVVAEQEGMNSVMSEYLNVMAEDSEITPPNPPKPTVPGTVADAIPGEGEEVYIFEETTQIADASGDNMWVAKGFGIASDSATDIDDGVVITTADNTKQFVWIPVDETSLNEMYQSASGTKLTGVTTTTNVYSKLRIRSGDSYTEGAPNSTNVREPDVLSSYDTSSSYYQDILGYASTKDMADAMVAEYAATYASIEQYDGFYIGRYELTGSVDVPTVQKGQAVLTGQNWYNLKKACTNVVNGDEYGAQSTMIYGNQWDEVMDWLVDTGMSSDLVNKDSSSWGNYSNSTGAAATDSGSKQPTGTNEAWQANNIYDLAGNCYEWTQEAYNTNYRVRRGGSCYNSGYGYPASDRNYYYPDYSSGDYSSRPALYITRSVS